MRDYGVDMLDPQTDGNAGMIAVQRRADDPDFQEAQEAQPTADEATSTPKDLIPSRRRRDMPRSRLPSSWSGGGAGIDSARSGQCTAAGRWRWRPWPPATSRPSTTRSSRPPRRRWPGDGMVMSGPTTAGADETTPPRAVTADEGLPPSSACCCGGRRCRRDGCRRVGIRRRHPGDAPTTNEPLQLVDGMSAGSSWRWPRSSTGRSDGTAAPAAAQRHADRPTWQPATSSNPVRVIAEVDVAADHRPAGADPALALARSVGGGRRERHPAARVHPGDVGYTESTT